MRWLKRLSLAVAGVVLPVALVFSAYLIASGAIGDAGRAVPPVPQNRVTETEGTPAPTPTESDRRDDRGGRCSEAEHRDDPECVSETPSEDSDNSGPGSDNSGPGSDNSGPGSDNSGSGSDGSGKSGDD